MRTHRAMAATLIFVSSLQSPPARADLFGGDVVELAAILSELLNQGLQLRNQLQQIEAQVNLTRQTVKQLDARSFSGLLDSYNSTRYTMQSITGQVNAMRFNIQQINGDFDRLFPRTQKAWKGVNAAQAGDRYEAWNSEITGSSLIAMRAQSRLEDVQAMNAQAAAALAASRASDGEVRQLQALNQMLAVVQGQMSTLIQLLSTGGRVTANLAASAAGEKMLIREAKARRRDGYTNKGAPPRKLTRLP